MSSSKRPHNAAQIEAIESAVTDPLRELSMDVEAIELTPAGKRRVLRIAVDKDGGVTLDDVAAATRRINEVLDADDNTVMGEQAYTLEVTSRGVDRLLTLPRHWRRNVTRLVKVTLSDEGTTADTVTGRITASDDDSVTLDLDGTERRIRFGDIRKALVQVEFSKSSNKKSNKKSED